MTDPRTVHVFDQLGAHLMAIADTVATYHLELMSRGVSDVSAALLSRDVQRRLLGEVDRAIEDASSDDDQQ